MLGALFGNRTFTVNYLLIKNRNKLILNKKVHNSIALLFLLNKKTRNRKKDYETDHPSTKDGDKNSMQ